MTSDRQLRKNPRQLLLQIAQTAGVLYSVRRPRGFFGLCQLAGGALVERFVAAGAARAAARTASSATIAIVAS